VIVCAAFALACGGTTPTATNTQPLAYQQASLVRGAQLYDVWWSVPGVKNPTAPTTDNPGYAKTSGTKKGASTWRCRECHGIDYKGRDGLYATGAHFTGVAGLLADQTADPSALAAVIRDGEAGSAMTAMKDNLSDADIWDLVKFIREGTTDLAGRIDATSNAPAHGDPARGHQLYTDNCARCHGDDGRTLNFHAGQATPEYVGTVASEDPYGLTHRIRFSVPGKTTPGGETMPAFVDKGFTLDDVMDVIAYARLLPVN
jgi:thiosulfate dehydrogenase